MNGSRQATLRLEPGTNRRDGSGMRLLALLSLLIGLSACKTLPVAGACSESAGLRCLTAPDCVYDRQRDCMMCRCGEPLPRSDRQPDTGTRPASPPTDPTRP